MILIPLDCSNWTQEQKNMTKAMCVKLLADANISYDSVGVCEDTIQLDTSSTDENLIYDTLAQAKIEQAYSDWKTQSDALTAQAIAEETAKMEFVDSSQIKTLSFNDIDFAVDELSNLDEVKEFLKEFVKVFKARANL